MGKTRPIINDREAIILAVCVRKHSMLIAHTSPFPLFSFKLCGLINY